MPSSVLTRRAVEVSTGTRQDITASPSSRHVQVPQVPRRSRAWRRSGRACRAARPAASCRAWRGTPARLAVDFEFDDARRHWLSSSADVDGQDAAAVPGAGVGVVERVGGLDGQPRPRPGDVALRRAPPRRRARGRAAGDAAERDPRAVGGDGDDRGAVLLAAHGLACRTSARGLEAEAVTRPVASTSRPRARRLVDDRTRRRARAGRPRGRRAAGARTGCRRPSPGCGSWGRRSTRSRRAGTATSRADLGERRRRADRAPVAVALDAGQAGAAQADERLGRAAGAASRACRRRSACPRRAARRPRRPTSGTWTFIRPPPPGCAARRCPRSRTRRRRRP